MVLNTSFAKDIQSLYPEIAFTKTKIQRDSSRTGYEGNGHPTPNAYHTPKTCLVALRQYRNMHAWTTDRARRGAAVGFISVPRRVLNQEPTACPGCSFSQSNLTHVHLFVTDFLLPLCTCTLVVIFRVHLAMREESRLPVLQIIALRRQRL